MRVFATKYMVGSTAALGKGPLEGVGDVGVCHEVHKASVKNTSEELAKAASDGDGAVVSWVMFGAFFMEGGYIGFLP